jgi:hypothetical protein
MSINTRARVMLEGQLVSDCNTADARGPSLSIFVVWGLPSVSLMTGGRVIYKSNSYGARPLLSGATGYQAHGCLWPHLVIHPSPGRWPWYRLNGFIKRQGRHRQRRRASSDRPSTSTMRIGAGNASEGVKGRVALSKAARLMVD